MRVNIKEEVMREKEGFFHSFADSLLLLIKTEAWESW